MVHWIADLVNSLNYWGIAILMAIENVVLPIPSELIMPLAGFETASGRLSIPRAIMAGTLGSVVGGLPLYYAGYALGENRVRQWFRRYGKWVLLRRKSDLDRATGRFSNNNFLAVLVGQLLPGVRGLISIPAGVARMNLALFLLANFLGTVVWCAVLVFAGRLLGAHFMKVYRFLGPAGWGILGALVLGLAVWLMLRRRNRLATGRSLGDERRAGLP
jgi:membrane protein DedA with SNARE-associated domain